MTGSALVLVLAIVFQGDPADLQTASMVSVLPLPPSPPYVAGDARLTCWFLAYCLALQIDQRGEMLARGGLDQDVVAALKLANLLDARAMVSWVSLFNELESRVSCLQQ
jgi:hypothetical protein